MRVRYHSRATSDIDQIYRYLHERSPIGAQNVLRSIFAGINIAGAMPYACQQVDRPNVRVKLVKRYRYKIFFKIVEGDMIEILHVRHASRRPWVVEA